MATLSPEEIDEALTGLAGWEAAEDAIRREVRLSDFREAVAFVVRVAFEAESRNHHPDVDLRYNRVTLLVSTHSEGGVTAKDLELAAAIDRLLG